MAAVAGTQWRREARLPGGDTSPELKLFWKTWLLFEPILFALIGTEIRVGSGMDNLDNITRRGLCPRTGLRAAVNEYFCG